MPAATRSTSLTDLLTVCRQMFSATSEDLIGLECEWPVRRLGDPLARPDLNVLERLGDEPLPSAGMITVEPGGQIELSSAPEHSVGDAIRAVEADATVLHDRLRRAGLEPEAVAVDAIRSPRRILDRPRYRAMEAHFDRAGAAGRWMMCNTASVQVNISNAPADPCGRWRVLNHVSPILLAMFANSGAIDSGGTTWHPRGRASGGTSTRPAPARSPLASTRPRTGWPTPCGPKSSSSRPRGPPARAGSGSPRT